MPMPMTNPLPMPKVGTPALPAPIVPPPGGKLGN
jgi:hypothetical protein